MASTKIPATAQATKGTVVSWAEGVTAGVKPTAGWIPIPGIVTWPKIGGTADTFETTTIDEDYMKTYAMGLIDPGGAQDVTYNVNQSTIDIIYDMYDAQQSGKEVWVQITMPAPLSTNYYYTVQVSPPIGSPEVGINGVLQDTFSVAYSGNFSTAPITTP